MLCHVTKYFLIVGYRVKLKTGVMGSENLALISQEYISNIGY